MIETYEFRISSEAVPKFIGEPCGTPRGAFPGDDFVRVTKTRPGTELYARIERAVTENPDEFIYAGWSIARKYSAHELREAKVFKMVITSRFEPFGEECGTEYDESSSCPDCGGGAVRRGPLVLNLRKAPKSKHLSGTLAPEYIVSQEVAEMVRANGITGCELRPVVHKAYLRNKPIEFDRVPSGRALLAKAKKLRVADWRLSIWLYEPEQADLLEKAYQEYDVVFKRKEQTPVRCWYELVVTSPPVRIVAPTVTGHGPFDLDESRASRCRKAGQLGHVLGLNTLSEVHIDGKTWDGSDVAVTEQLIGDRCGLLRPRPEILISPRFHTLLREAKMKGFYSEVAYLC